MRYAVVAVAALGVTHMLLGPGASQRGRTARADVGKSLSDRLALLALPRAWLGAPTARGAQEALATWFESHVYAAPESRRRVIGVVRRGTVLPAGARLRGPGCPRGRWYALTSGGAVCTTRGFIVGAATPRAAFRLRQPVLSRPLPFEYGRVNTRSAQRYLTIPSVNAEARYARAARGGRRLPSSVKHLDGDYFVAIDREVVDGSRTFYRTVRGRYLRKRQVDIKTEPAMRGELLTQKTSLPLAFVYAEDPGKGRQPPPAPLFAYDSGSGGNLRQVGSAPYHSRFHVGSIKRWAGRPMVITSAGQGVARERVRIATRRPRPARVGARDKWIHIDLDEQTLVAYRGDVPVFATLVSSGRLDGYATPTGLFRIREKRLTATMRGADPVDGPYEVGDVPWTMYYDGSYALHGAYWHDSFGRPRSHGCTNLSPIDARWLFYWSDGSLPQGWHGGRDLRGAWVYFTSAGRL